MFLNVKDKLMIIIGILKSLLYMVIFLFFIRFINYIIRLFLFLKNKPNIIEKESDLTSSLNMLQCEKCKTYVLKSEAYFINGKVYCKKEHSL